MALPIIFDLAVSSSLINRIQNLNPLSKPLWGKMSVSQMLAHCNVTYEYVYEPEKYRRPSAFMKFILKNLVKNSVVNEVPYKQSIKTGPDFIVKDEKNFESEKQRLIQFITRTTELGASHFEGKESHSFGKLSSTEWNNMFYKHLHHHLSQFGV